MRVRIFALGLLVATLCTARVATASETLFLAFWTGAELTVFRIDVERRAVTGTYRIDGYTGAALGTLTADGRHLSWVDGQSPASTQRALHLLDTSTGHDVAVWSWPFSPVLVAHPSRLQLYANYEFPRAQGYVAILTPAGEDRLPRPACVYGEFWGEFVGLSGDGARTLHTCSRENRGVVVQDAVTGAEVGYVPVVGGLALDEHGDALYVARNPTTLERIDVATNVTLASNSTAFSAGLLQFWADRRTGRVFANDGTGVSAFDPLTLAPLGRFPLPAAARVHSTVVPHPSKPSAYLLHPYDGDDNWANGYLLSIFDTDTMTLAASYHLPIPARFGWLIVGRDPPPPSGLTAVVAGSSVELQWTPDPKSPLLTQYVVEAGAGPGATSVSVTTAGPQLTVNVVPPGTYYVRARSANYSGASSPSAELTVIVP
jgi:hypothetical protein